jgi:hypothetical protein
MDAEERKTVSEANEAQRQAMRELLYRKDSQSLSQVHPLSR